MKIAKKILNCDYLSIVNINYFKIDILLFPIYNMSVQNSHHRKILMFLTGTSGIFFSYILLAIFAEHLYSAKYTSTVKFKKDGSAAEHQFVHPSIVVLLTALCCVLFGLAKSRWHKQARNPIAPEQALLAGLFNAINTTATNFSLLYLSYPTQVISSSARYLLVVLVGTYLSRVTLKSELKIPKHKVYVALLITFGVILFNVAKTKSKPKHSQSGNSEWLGYGLVMAAMVADAFFCDAQAYIKASYRPTANQMFTAVNLCACLLSLGFSLMTGQLFAGMRFIMQHPACSPYLIGVCMLQVTGQMSIYYIVANFKQHVFPLISTTRKILTIAFSIILFGHRLNVYQWVAICGIFVGMGVEVYEEVVKKKAEFFQFSTIQIVVEDELGSVEGIK